MKRLLRPLALAAACLSPLGLLAQTPLSLEQALEMASTRSPLIAAARKELEAAQGASQQAALWRNPELSATFEDPRRDSRTTTISVDVPLEIGGQRPARIQAAQRGQALAAAELERAGVELRAEVVQAFFALLMAQERVQLVRGSAEIAARAAEAVAKRVAAGKLSPVEATRAQVDRAQAELELDEAGSDLQRARFALATLLGEAAPSFEQVQGDLAAPQRPDFAALQARLDDAPALQIGRLEAARRAALLELERSKRMPELRLSLGSKHDAAAGRSQAIVGLSMPLPIFDRNQGAVLEAARRADKAQDELHATRLRLLADLQDASQRLAMANRSLQSLQQAVLPAAQQAYESASKGFEAGKFGFLEVLDAQRAWLQARTRTLNTLAAAHQAAAAIDRITGR